MKNFIILMLSAASGQISSKRVCGVVGWLLCLLVAGVATFKCINIPGFLDTVALVSAGLLGVDSVTSIWKK